MARVVIFDSVLEEVLRSPVGPVGREMFRRGEKVAELTIAFDHSTGAGIMWPEFVRTRLRGVPRGTPGRLDMWGPPSGHRSSVPFAHPAYDTGNLARSVGVRAVETVYGPSADIYYDLAIAPYAGYVELGTRYMEPRPALRPALVAAAG